MAKKSKKKDTEVITNCDNQKLAITNCDFKNLNIESLIHTIRGQKIMFDSDLAMLYGVETRVLNQAVKRNLRRFPDDFMFQLSKEEWNALRSQIVTLEDLETQGQVSVSRRDIFKRNIQMIFGIALV